jgi:hypothetical protein
MDDARSTLLADSRRVPSVGGGSAPAPVGSVRSDGRRRGVRLALIAVLAALACAVLPGAALASSVTNFTMVPSSTAATATQVTYTATFRATTALAANTGTVTIIAPGVTFPSGGCDYFFDDQTTFHTDQCLSVAGQGTDDIVVTVPYQVNAGNTVSITIEGSVNPPGSGSEADSISTSSDNTAVNDTVTYTGPTAVTGATLDTSSTSADATAVTYTLSFTPTNLLSGTAVVNLTVPGATFPASTCDYTIENRSTLQSDQCPAVSGGGTDSVAVGISNVVYSAGQGVQLTIIGVSNPTASGSPASKVSTSSDPSNVSLTTPFATETALSSLELTQTSTSEDATDVTYVANGITKNGTTPNSNITLTVPGATLPSNGCDYIVENLSTTVTEGPCLTVVSGGASDTVTVQTNYLTVAAGQRIQLTAIDVSNPPSSGDQSVALSTSSDPLPVTQTVDFTPNTAVRELDLTESSTSANATGVTYTAIFTPSNPLDSHSTVTLTVPGATFPVATYCGQYEIIDVSTGQSNTCTSVTGTGSDALTFTMGSFNVTTSQRLEVVAGNVSNPTSSGDETVSVSTSSDPGTATQVVDYTASTAVRSLELTESSTSAGATNVTYQGSFIPTNALEGDSTVTLTVPGATFTTLTYCGEDQIINESTTQSATCITFSGAGTDSLTFDLNTDGGVQATDVQRVEFIAESVTNPASSGDQSITVSTSSDPAPVTKVVDFTSETSVASVIFAQTSTSAGATDLDYSATFVSTNSLTGDATATLTIPGGAFASTYNYCGEYELINVTTGQSLTCPNIVTSDEGTDTMTIETQNNFTATPGQVVELIANSVANPASSGDESIAVSTSSDPKPATKTIDYTADTAVRSVQLTESSTSSDATLVTYTLSFVPTNALNPQSTVTLTLPGADFASSYSCDYSLTNVSLYNVYNTCPSGISGSGDTATIPLNNFSVTSSQRLQVVVQGVSNPTTSGDQTFSVTTSSDPAAATKVIDFTAPTAPKAFTVTPSTLVAGSANVSYTISFEPTNELYGRLSAFTITVPGATFPTNNCDYMITNETTTQSVTCPPTSETLSDSVTVEIDGITTTASEPLQVVVTGVGNPSDPGSVTATASTTSDPAAATKSVVFVGGGKAAKGAQPVSSSVGSAQPSQASGSASGSAATATTLSSSVATHANATTRTKGRTGSGRRLSRRRSTKKVRAGARKTRRRARGAARRRTR